MGAVVLVGQGNQSAEHRRHANHGVRLPLTLLAQRLDPQDDVEALVQEVRKGMRGVDGQGGQDGKNLALEVVVEEGVLVLVELAAVADDDPVLGEGGSDLVLPDAILPADEVMATPARSR